VQICRTSRWTSRNIHKYPRCAWECWVPAHASDLHTSCSEAFYSRTKTSLFQPSTIHNHDDDSQTPNPDSTQTQHHSTKKHPTVPLYPFPHSPFSCSETLWIILLVITRWRRGVSTLRTRKSPWRGPPSPPLLPITPATHPTTALCFRAAPTPHVGACRLCWPVVQATDLPARHMCCTVIIILLSQ
jgi:hypothetical protein